MNTTPAILYLILLLGSLVLIVTLLFKEILKKRNLERSFTQSKQRVDSEEATYQDYYFIGSFYLYKKLFDQAILYFSYCLQCVSNMDTSELSNLYNAIGFTYSESGQVDLSIFYYIEALNTDSTNILVMNNLAYSYEKKKLLLEASEIYRQVLSIDNSNEIARDRLTSLKRKIRNRDDRI